jgi:hypothetical protein
LTFNGLHSVISQETELFKLNVDRKRRILEGREAGVQVVM